MEAVFGWVAVVIGAAAALLGAAASLRRVQGEGPDGTLWVAITSVAATLIMFSVTLPIEPPTVFSMGQRLGYGILIGGLLGTLAGVWSVRLRGSSPWSSQVSAAGIAGLALLGTGIVLLLFRDYPQASLGGFLIGAVASSAFFRIALPSSERVDLWTLSAITLGTTVMLSTFRYNTPDGRIWWYAPLMILAAIVIAAVATAGLAKRDDRSALTSAAAVVFTLVLVALFAWRMFPDWSLLWAALAGAGTIAITAWLAAPAAASNAAAAGAALLVVALSAVGFKLLGGFGIGVGLIAAWPIFLPVAASVRRVELQDEERVHPERLVVYALFTGAGFLLLRLFLETYSLELRGPDLRAHYTFVALAVGAMLPFVISSAFPVSGGSGRWWKLLNAGAVGTFAAASPLVMLVAWGFKAELGFLIGTAASMIFLLFANTGAIRVRGQDFEQPAVLVTAAQVSAVQFSMLLGPLSDSSRATRLAVLGIAVLAGLVWSGISLLIARRTSGEG